MKFFIEFYFSKMPQAEAIDILREIEQTLTFMMMNSFPSNNALSNSQDQNEEIQNGEIKK